VLLGRLVLLLTVVPLLELYFLLQLGARLGATPTLAIVIVTGLVGASLLRFQGGLALGRIRDALGAGRVPTTALVDGLLIAIAGVLLLTPGVVTDTLGLFLLIPAGRAVVRRMLRRRWDQWVRDHQVGGPGADGF